MSEQEVGKLVVKVGLDGTGFQNGVSNLNRQLRVVQSEFEAASAKIGKFGSSADALRLKADSLSKQIELQRQKVSVLQQAFEQSAASKGRDAKATQDLEIKTNKARAALHQMENALKSTNAELQKQASLNSSVSRLRTQFQGLADQVKGNFQTIREHAVTTMAVIGSAITTGLGALAGAGVKFNADMEKTAMSFEILLGSAEKAKQMMADLKELAFKSPFEFQGLEKSAKMLLAMGFNSQQVIPMLYTLGDAVAAVGGNTAQMEGIALAIGQIMTKGKVSAEEMNQLAERGIGAWDILSQKLGKTKQELMAMAADGKLYAETAIPALLEGLQARAGAMEKLSKTFSGMLTNLKESLRADLGNATAPLFAVLREDLEGVVQKLNEMRQNGSLQQWSKETGKALVSVWNTLKTVGSAFVSIAKAIKDNWSVIGPILYGVTASMASMKIIGTVSFLWKVYRDSAFAATLAQHGLNAALRANPIGMIVTAIGVLVTASFTLYNAWKENWGGIQEKTRAVVQVVKSYFSVLVNGVLTEFYALRTGVLAIINRILNFVRPVVDLIGQIAPGFSAGFNNVQRAIESSMNASEQSMKKFAGETVESFDKLITAGSNLKKEFSSWKTPVKEMSIQDEMRSLREQTNQTRQEVTKTTHSFADLGKQVKAASDTSKKGAKDTREEWQKTSDGLKAAVELVRAQFEISMARLGQAAPEAKKLNNELFYLRLEYDKQKAVVERVAKGYQEMVNNKKKTTKEVLEAAKAYASEANTLNDLAKKISDVELALAAKGYETMKVRAELEKLNAQNELAIANLSVEATRSEELRVKLQGLNATLSEQTQLVKALEREYRAMLAAKGKDAEETHRAYMEWMKAKTEQANLQKEIRNTNTELKNQAKEIRALKEEAANVARKYTEELARAQEEYRKKVEETNRKLAEDERQLTERYQQEVENRAKSLRDFVGLFDAVTKKNVSGTQLLDNLKSQVTAFEEWQKNMQSLANKGIDQALLQELRDMGPRAGAEIAALNSLSDAELAEYVELWRQKSQAAKQEAQQQLQQQRLEMEQKISEVRIAAAQQLELYRQEWAKKNAEIRQNTETELKKIEDKYRELTGKSMAHGRDFMVGFSEGMKSRFNELTQTIDTMTILVDKSISFGTENSSDGDKKGAKSLKRVFTELENSVKQSILNISQSSRQSTSEMWDHIVTVFADAITRILATLADLRKQMNDRWEEMRKDAKDMGKNIIQGLIDGMESMATKLAQRTKSIVQGAVSQAKASLQINSPSRVFKEIGVFTIEGFILGIESGIDRLRAASTQMALAPVPGSSAASYGATTASRKSDLSSPPSVVNQYQFAEGAVVISVKDLMELQRAADFFKLLPQVARSGG